MCFLCMEDSNYKSIFEQASKSDSYLTQIPKYSTIYDIQSIMVWMTLFYLNTYATVHIPIAYNVPAYQSELTGLNSLKRLKSEKHHSSSLQLWTFWSLSTFIFIWRWLRRECFQLMLIYFINMIIEKLEPQSFYICIFNINSK